MENWIYLLIVSMLPWIELRGAIPLGILKYGYSPILVFLACTTANILIIPFINLFLDVFFDFMCRFRLFSFCVNRTQRKAGRHVEKYGPIGLALFVGVPLPGTGAYSGCLAAHILGVRGRTSNLAVAAGVLIAGIGVTLLSTVLYESLGWILDIL